VASLTVRLPPATDGVAGGSAIGGASVPGVSMPWLGIIMIALLTVDIYIRDVKSASYPDCQHRGQHRGATACNRASISSTNRPICRDFPIRHCSSRSLPRGQHFPVITTGWQQPASVVHARRCGHDHVGDIRFPRRGITSHASSAPLKSLFARTANFIYGPASAVDGLEPECDLHGKRKGQSHGL
jgi:hypothetical protein